MAVIEKVTGTLKRFDNSAYKLWLQPREPDAAEKMYGYDESNLDEDDLIDKLNRVVICVLTDGVVTDIDDG